MSEQLRTAIERDAQFAASWNESTFTGVYPASLAGSPPPIVHGPFWRAEFGGPIGGMISYHIHIDKEIRRAGANQR